MQQLSGSSGRGGTQTPAIKTLFFWISDLRSRGEESREEKRIAGSGSSAGSFSWAENGGLVEGAADVGGFGFDVGVEDSRRDA